jgi:hypothetical protein
MPASIIGALYQYVYWRQFLSCTQEPDADNRYIAGMLSTLDRALAPVAEPD